MGSSHFAGINGDLNIICLWKIETSKAVPRLFLNWIQLHSIGLEIKDV